MRPAQSKHVYSCAKTSCPGFLGRRLLSLRAFLCEETPRARRVPLEVLHDEQGASVCETRSTICYQDGSIESSLIYSQSFGVWIGLPLGFPGPTGFGAGVFTSCEFGRVAPVFCLNMLATDLMPESFALPGKAV